MGYVIGRDGVDGHHVGHLLGHSIDLLRRSGTLSARFLLPRPKEPPPMSDTNEAHDTAGLLDAGGNVIPAPKSAVACVEAYIRADPIKGALIALALGWVIGRLRLII